jgi:hypothetical protein
MLSFRQALQEHLTRMGIEEYFSTLDPAHIPRDQRKPFTLHDLIRSLAVLLPTERRPDLSIGLENMSAAPKRSKIFTICRIAQSTYLNFSMQSPLQVF